MIEIGEHDGLAAVAADEIAGGEHADAGDFQIGRNDAAGVGVFPPGEMPRQHPPLLIGRLDQSVADAAMLGAFADREYVRRSGLQVVVDHDAAVDGNAGLLCQCDVRPDAGREDHGVGRNQAAARQFNAFDARHAVDACGIGIEQDFDPLALDQGFQKFGRGRIQLALHQAVHQMHQRHRRAGLGKPISRFEAEQSAADHHHALLLRSQRLKKIDLAAITERMHAGEVGTRHVEPQRRRACGQHQF